MGGGSYVKTGKDEDESTTVIFCLPEGVGVLADALKIFHVSYTLLFPIVYVWVTAVCTCTPDSTYLYSLVSNTRHTGPIEV